MSDLDFQAQKFQEEMVKYMKENYPLLWEQFKLYASFPTKGFARLHFEETKEVTEDYERFVKFMTDFENRYHAS